MGALDSWKQCKWMLIGLANQYWALCQVKWSEINLDYTAPALEKALKEFPSSLRKSSNVVENKMLLHLISSAVIDLKKGFFSHQRYWSLLLKLEGNSFIIENSTTNHELRTAALLCYLCIITSIAYKPRHAKYPPIK